MKKLIITGTVILFTLQVIMLYPQSYRGKGRLKGIVTDMEGNPLEGVSVKLLSTKDNSSFEVKTNKEGEWEANWIRGGMWHIDFLKTGYEPKKISFTVSELGRNPLIEIQMKKIEGLALTEDIVKKVEAANELYTQGKYVEAISSYQNILQEYPDVYIINKNIGNAYFAMGEYEKAIEYYQRLLENEGEGAEVCILIGNSYINLKEDQKAFEWYNKVDAADVQDILALYNIGVLYFNKGRPEKAVSYLKKAVEIDDTFADAFYQLGLSYVSTGQTEEAIQALEKFLQLKPDSENASTAESLIAALRKNF